MVPGKNPIPDVQMKIMVSPQDFVEGHHKLDLEGRIRRREFQMDGQNHEGETKQSTFRLWISDTELLVRALAMLCPNETFIYLLDH